MKGKKSFTKVHSSRNASKSSSFNSRTRHEKPHGDISAEESLDGSQSDLSYEESVDLDSSQPQELEAEIDEEAGEEEPEQPPTRSKERSSRKKPPPMPTTIEGLDTRIAELKKRQETLSLLKNKQHRRSLFESIRHQIIKVFMFAKIVVFFL